MFCMVVGGNGDTTIIIDDTQSCSKEQLWIPSLELYSTDHLALVGCEWINDRLINAGQRLLKEAYPCIGNLGQLIQGYEPETCEFVQVLHVASSHWVTISTIGCSLGEVNMSDSLMPKDLPDWAQKQIACILCTREKTLQVKLYV